MKINFGKKKYWKYGLKKFSFYTLVGLIASNIPIPLFGMYFGAIAIIIVALMISVTDTLQIINIDDGIKIDHHIVFSSRNKKVIARTFLLLLIYIIFMISYNYLSK